LEALGTQSAPGITKPLKTSGRRRGPSSQL